MKICLITHVADLDGATPIILSKLVFKNLEHFSCDIKDVDDTLKTVLMNEQNYDYIFITDLNISEELAIEIEKNDKLKEKIKIFDHHQSSMEMNKFSFIKVVVEENGYYECGTTLYLKFLKEFTRNKILNKKSIKYFTELVRQIDTYHFIDKKSAMEIDDLYSIYGRERFIEIYTKYLRKNNNFKFSKIEKKLLEIENIKKEDYIEKKLEHVIKTNIKDIKVGIIFAEKYRSLIGNRLAEENDDIDIAIIINIDKSVSYRAIKEDVDVTSLASIYGGGGHKHAAGSSLKEDLKEKIIDLIFEDK